MMVVRAERRVKLGHKVSVKQQWVSFRGLPFNSFRGTYGQQYYIVQLKMCSDGRPHFNCSYHTLKKQQTNNAGEGDQQCVFQRPLCDSDTHSSLRTSGLSLLVYFHSAS